MGATAALHQGLKNFPIHSHPEPQERGDLARFRPYLGGYLILGESRILALPTGGRTNFTLLLHGFDGQVTHENPRNFTIRRTSIRERR